MFRCYRSCVRIGRGTHKVSLGTHVQQLAQLFLALHFFLGASRQTTKQWTISEEFIIDAALKYAIRAEFTVH
jgi:hypothetical protein